jgi:hypothetical protein
MAAPPMQKAASRVPPAGRRHSMGGGAPGLNLEVPALSAQTACWPPKSIARNQMRRTPFFLACGMNLLQTFAESSMAHRDRLGGAPAGRNPTTMGRSALLERYSDLQGQHRPLSPSA